MKKTIKTSLSLKSIKEAIQALEGYIKALSSGTRKGVEEATEALYKKIIDNCTAGNLGEFTDRIHKDFNKEKNEGRVWTDDMIIIINEFGSGIGGYKERSLDKEYASKHGYTINMSGKGEAGWKYPKKDGSFGLTSGIRSKKMIYEAYEEIKKEYGRYMNISLDGEIGRFYY